MVITEGVRDVVGKSTGIGLHNLLRSSSNALEESKINCPVSVFLKICNFLVKELNCSGPLDDLKLPILKINSPGCLGFLSKGVFIIYDLGVEELTRTAVQNLVPP